MDGYIFMFNFFKIADNVYPCGLSKNDAENKEVYLWNLSKHIVFHASLSNKYMYLSFLMSEAIFSYS